MYHESAMVDDLNLNTECANYKFIILVKINGIQVQVIRDTGNVGATLVSETLVPKSALDHDQAISMVGVFNEKPKQIPTTLRFSVIGCNKTDSEILVRMGVCSLPRGVMCVLGNDIFVKYQQLSDIVAVSDITGVGVHNETSHVSSKINDCGLVTETDNAMHNATDTPGVHEMTDEVGEVICVNPEKPSYALSSEGVSINHGSSSVIKNDRGKTRNAVESSGVSVSGLSADQQVTRSDCSPGNKLTRSRNRNLILPTDTAVEDAAKTSIGPINIITRSRAGRASRVPDTNASNIASDDTDRCTRHIDVTDINKVEQSDKTKFAHEQHTDAGLQHYLRMASNNESTFVVQNRLLYKRIPSRISSLNEFALVLPACREKEVIRLAHDHCPSGHLGVRKSEKRINSLFYFPKMRQKVRCHINTCNSCQMTKPVKRNERVRLQKSMCWQNTLLIIYRSI